MGRFDAAKKMLHAKAIEVLGEDTVENLKDIGKDAVKAGNQVKSVAKEVWEDCDNEVLENARNFYSGAAQKTKNGVQNSIKAAQKSAEARKVAREEARRLREERRKKLMKRVFPILIGMVITVLLLFSAVFWFSQRDSGRHEAVSQFSTELQSFAAPEEQPASEAPESPSD